MPTLWLAILVVYPVFAVLAVSVAWRLPSHRWVAGYVVWMAAADWIRVPTRRFMHSTPAPCSGIAQIVFHVDRVIVLSWSLLFAALCLHYFVRRLTWLVVPASLLALAAGADCGAMYADARSLVYRAVALTTTVVAWSSIGWGLLRRANLKPDLSHLTLILYAATDVVAAATVWLAADVAKSWGLYRVSNMVLFVACIVAHAWWLLRRHPRQLSA